MTNKRAAARWTGRSNGSKGRTWTLAGVLLAALGLARAAVAQSPVGPLPNAGFETGDLSRWTTGCYSAGGGCDNWSVIVGPQYAYSGRFGARLFNANVGLWGHAQLSTELFEDGAATYTIPMKLVGGATQFFSGVIIGIVERNTGRSVRYQGNSLGSVYWPASDMTGCGLFRMIPGAWVEYTFDFQNDFLRQYGRLPGRERWIVIDAYQTDDAVDFYVDDVLVPRTQQSPVTVAALALSRTEVASADTVTGEVTLNAPAPPGGAVVTITSRNQGVPAPPPLLIPEGETRGSFTLQAGFAPTTRTGWITAICGRGAASADLTVRSGPVTSLTLQEDRLIGGAIITGAVQFAAPTAPERVDITLVSSDPAVAAIPDRVSLRPGNSRAEFTVTTAPVAAPMTVYITAASQAGVAVTRLLVTPLPSGQPAALAAVTLAQGMVTGGSGTVATVRLNGPAPPGGAAVALATNAGTTVAAPASVTVPAGATTASAALATQPVATSVTASVTASYAGQARTATLAVQPPALDAITLDLLAVLGGDGTGATVTLTGPAPAGGAVIALASSAPAMAAVPSAVVIPAGARGVDFPVLTQLPSDWTRVTLSASFNGAVRSAMLQIDPVPALRLTLRYDEVLGGAPNLGIFTLSGPPWWSGPLTVALSSTRPDLALAPAAVTLVPGQHVVTFPVTTFPADRNEGAEIVASWGTGSSMSTGMRLLPPELLTVPISPTAVSGGATAVGSFLFTAAAPAAGSRITLVSSNAALAAVPAAVTVPPGMATVSFPIVTSVVTSTQAVTITATCRGVTRKGTLVLAGTRLSSLVLSPSSVLGGTLSQGTITVAEPAPPGGIVIPLTSDNPAAAVPASVGLPAGATSATFVVTTQSVNSATAAVVTSEYAGLSQKAALTVLAPALAALTLDAATVAGGGSVRVTVTLTGPAPPGGAVIAFSGDNPALAALPPTVIVPAGGIVVRFPVAISLVNALTPVAISASYAGVTRSVMLAVAPVKLAWLRLGRESVLGGTEIVGAMMLEEPAPPGGVTVMLTSDRPELVVPPEGVRIEEGTRLAFFSMATTPVASATPVTLTATVGGTRQAVMLQLLPTTGS